MVRARMIVRASVAVAALVIGATGGVAAACPPSEGDYDFTNFDVSGDGSVMLPETVQIKAVASTSKTDGDGKIVVDKRVALVVQDPTHNNQQVMAMHMTPLGASEVKEWLESAITAQESWLKESKQAEKPGIECTLDAKRCREMTKAGAEKKANVPSMWVTVTSRGGERHGWSLMAAADEPAVTVTSCGVTKGETAKAAPADPRIAITTYDRSAGGRPMTIRMDTPTAKTLLAELGRAIDEREGKVQPVVPAVDKKDAAAGAS